MATEKVVTKIKYRLKNGASTTLPLGTTSDYIKMNDGLQETLTQRIATIEANADLTVRPKELDILKVQSHLNDGTIEKYCKVGDYVILNPAGKGNTRFYVIGINGHNGQLPDSIYKDHIDFYGGAITDFGSSLPSLNYTRGDAVQPAAWRTTDFFTDYVNNSSYSSGAEIRRNFFGLNESYQSLNFAPKLISYDQRYTETEPVSKLLDYFGFTYTDELWAKFKRLATYEYEDEVSIDVQNHTISLSSDFTTAITSIETDPVISFKLLRASVSLEPNLKTFPVDAGDSLVASRHYVGSVTEAKELIHLYNLYMRIYEWILANTVPELTSSTGISRNNWFLWMVTEEEIDNSNILGTPQYTALTGYTYPFFQNKQLFRLLFPASNISDAVFHSITPAEGDSSTYVSWKYNSEDGLYKGQQPAAFNTSIEGFGFRLESSSNLISYPI